MNERRLLRALLVLVPLFVAPPLPAAPPDDIAKRVAAALAADQPVKASWYQPGVEDATAAMQGAIDSGAKTVIVENLGRPWNVERIHLASNQEMVFEKGVVVQAKRGSFRGLNDSLFTIAGKENVRLTGYGATLRMWREDYNRPPYEHGTWRHVLKMHGATNIRIAGLTLAESGGDGIYIAGGAGRQPSRNIEIRDVVCDRNYRQGMSVISVENLLMEDVVLRNTAGTPPEAGIDFEPNYAWEKLVNCVLRNCLAENNGTAGYVISLKTLNRDSTPISFRLEHCRSRGNRPGLQYISGNAPQRSAVRGTVDVIGCRFEGDKTAAIVISEKPADAARLQFQDCQLINAENKRKSAAPILFMTAAGNTENIGGVHLDCLVEDPIDRPPLQYLDIAGGLRLRDVTGKLALSRSGKQTVCVLDRRQLEAWIPAAAYVDIPPLDLSRMRLAPAMPLAEGMLHSCTGRQRGRAEFLIWAEAGKSAAFAIRVNTVGKGKPRSARVQLVAPSGKIGKLPDAHGGQEQPYTFVPAETGAHRIICAAENDTVQASSATHRICLYSPGRPFHFLGGGGQLYFWVPRGVARAAVKIGGGSESEMVKAALINPAGGKVAEYDNIAQARQFLIERPAGSSGEAWSLRISRPSEGYLDDHYVELQGIGSAFAGRPESLLEMERDNR